MDILAVQIVIKSTWIKAYAEQRNNYTDCISTKREHDHLCSSLWEVRRGRKVDTETHSQGLEMLAMELALNNSSIPFN